jgi:hypothetical protein
MYGYPHCQVAGLLLGEYPKAARTLSILLLIAPPEKSKIHTLLSRASRTVRVLLLLFDTPAERWGARSAMIFP